MAHAALLALGAIFAVSASPIRRQQDLVGCLQSANVRTLTSSSSTWSDAIQPYNQRLDGQYIPAAVAQVASTDDVVAAVKCAAQSNTPTVARSGGHSYTAYSLGGQNGALVIDVAYLNSITLDGDIATVGSGNRLGDVALSIYDQGKQAFGHGTCPQVGIGGHALAGGFGLDSRKFGLSLDRVVAHDVVLANGTLVTASAGQYSDLYWALRGAGWSYGIVTAFHIQTFDAPANTVYFSYNWDLDTTADNSAAAQAFLAFQDYGLNTAPAELGAEYNLGKGSSRGRLAVNLAGTFLGSQSDYEAAIQPLLAQLPAPDSNSVQNYGWLDALEALGGVSTLNTTGVADNRDTFFASSLMTPQSQPLGADAWQSFANYLGTSGFDSQTSWFCQVELYGGKNSAITAVAQDATAFANRDVLFTLQLYASSSDYAPPYPSDGTDFVDGITTSVTSHWPAGVPVKAYLNYDQDNLPSDGDGSWPALYFGPHYTRLQSIKQAYDPQQLFRWPQSVQPAAST